MTLKHWLKIPRFNWLKARIGRLVLNWKNLKTVSELQKKEVELMDSFLELKRKNTDESNLFADYKMKQIEIIKWILGENGV